MIEYNATNIKEMEEVMLSYLMKDWKGPPVFVHIEYEEEEEGLEDFTSYTTSFGQCSITQLFVFEISYDPKLKKDLDTFVTMIAHELIHVTQWLRGDTFDYTKPYRERPHEIEAYGREDEVASYYFKEVPQ